MLATLVDAPPAAPEKWVYEIKFDGYRLLAHIQTEGVRLTTRNGHDWTSKLPHLAKALASMKLKDGWLDGEIVILRESSGTSFQALQNAFDSSKTSDIVYYLFDVPFYGGYDLTQVPLIERRAFLQSLLIKAPAAIRFSGTFNAPPGELVTAACKMGLEGVIGKRKDSIYDSRRSPHWIKLKCSQRQEFVIGGWTDPKGSRAGLGSLLLGVHDAAGKLIYAGKVGSGFNDRSLLALLRKLKGLATNERPFDVPTADARHVHWVKPTLLAEVTFSEWTRSGHLRHPVFHALRTDKPAKAIVREEPVKLMGPDIDEQESAIPSRLKVSHPDRIIDASTGITKVEVVRYYGWVGELMMEHLRGRPVSFLRAPQGVNRQTFFQKHLEQPTMEGVLQLDPSLDPDHQRLIEVAKPIGLMSAAQMNVIEFHTWNAVKTDISKPDRITFDLDPGERVKWSAVQKAADLMRAFLTELGLAAFVKTSGSKGLHIVTPIRRQYDWDTVKDFSRFIVEHMSATLPQLFVAKSGPKNRVGKIFIDYLRNGFGATTVSAWSVRARPGLGISVPIAWPELAKVDSAAHWTLRNIKKRLEKGNTPWKDYDKSSKSITGAMKRIKFSQPKRGA